MKNVILTLVLITAYVFSFATIENSKRTDINTINYVKTNDNVRYFKKLRNGFNSRIIAKTLEGEKVVYNLDEVESYRINGKEYQRKYIVNATTQTVEKVFLQRLYTVAGYSLFKRVKTANERFKLSDLYVYKGDIQMHQLNKENHKIILSFFFPKYNQMFSK
jgi:ABC-type uncharacterized transport system substrate-binding protein